jgi:hypothetical protein
MAIGYALLEPGPILDPTARVAQCETSGCEDPCNKYPSGSMAVSNFMKCLINGSISDTKESIILELLLKALEAAA